MAINDELAHQQWSRFQWCRDRGHLDFIAKADRCDKFFAGDQWNIQDIQALELQRRLGLETVLFNAVDPALALAYGLALRRAP